MIQAVKDLQRLREITGVVVRHGFGELLDRSRIWDVLGRRDESARLSPEELRATSARRFRELLAELGPTFIKLGQILSSRPDLIPPDFVAELSKLQDDATPRNLAQAAQNLFDDTVTRRRLEALFAGFAAELSADTGALAAAAVADELARAGVSC